MDSIKKIGTLMNAKKNIYVTIIFISLFSNVLLFSQIRLGFDLGDKMKSNHQMLSGGIESETDKIENGIVIGYDHVLNSNNKMQFGVGGEFMINRGYKNIHFQGDFHFILYTALGNMILMRSFMAMVELGITFILEIKNT